MVATTSPRRLRFPGALQVAALLLGVWGFLNLAAAYPRLHGIWHDDHGCDDPVCAIATVAQGALDATPDATPPVARPWLAQEAPTPALAPLLIRLDCPPLPGRAPPV